MSEKFTKVVLSQGEYLSYSATEEDEFDLVTLGMLCNNTIPGLVPLQFLQMDTSRILRYDVSGKKSIVQMGLDKWSILDRIKVLKNIILTIIVSADYMVPKGLFILEKDKIFVNEETKEILLICLPIWRKEHKSLDVFCSEYLDVILPSLPVKMGNDLEQSTQSENFQIEKLMHLLEKVEIAITTGQAEKENQFEGRIVLNHTNVNPVVLKQTQSLGMQNERDRKYNSIILKHSEEKKNVEYEKTVFQSRIAIDSVIQEQKRRTILDENLTEQTDVLKLKNIDLEEEETEYLPELHVLRGFLLRKSTGEKIAISKKVFRIGKSKNSADYFVANNPAISRSHAVIIQNGEKFSLIDTNSSNHTYLNGKMIPTNKEVLLRNECVIRFANEEFIFFIENC